MRSPTVDWRNVSLLGIDVGFSRKRATTGIAVYEHGSLRSLCCVRSSPQDRADILNEGSRFDAIAIDGPILAATAADGLKRLSESLLIGRGFNVRCKPGMSHHGFGLDLRRAAAPIVAEACLLAKPASKAFGDRQIRHSIPLVEAFPNAFLGVLLDDADYRAIGPVSRGAKFDRVYERAVVAGRIHSVFGELGWKAPELMETVESEALNSSCASHEKRAALICLLTAACGLAGNAEYVGDALGGWICLPPQKIWAPWARLALMQRKATLQKRAAMISASGRC
jgi:predicted nuclease with RNAse H fold